MGALGYVMQVPEEEKYLNTEKELKAMLVGALAGRAAEELATAPDVARAMASRSTVSSRATFFE